MPNAMTMNSTTLSFTIIDCLLNLSAKLPAIGTISRNGSANTRPTSAKIVAELASPLSIAAAFHAISAYTMISLNTLSFIAPPNCVRLCHQNVFGSKCCFIEG